MAINQIGSVIGEIRGIKNEVSSTFNSIHSIGNKIADNKIVDNLNKISGVVSPVNAKEAPNFATMLKSAIDNVNALQENTANLRTAYEKGDPDVDIVEVMVAAQKSSVAFDATMQVRNKLVGAYQEIMRMPI